MADGARKLVVDSHIAGEFEGWDGETTFTLGNGDVWEQVHYAYRYHYAYHPHVRIWLDSGRYLLDVDGMNDTLEIRRQ
jgi:hypothetical protein